MLIYWYILFTLSNSDQKVKLHDNFQEKQINSNNNFNNYHKLAHKNVEEQVYGIIHTAQTRRFVSFISIKIFTRFEADKSTYMCNNNKIFSS